MGLGAYEVDVYYEAVKKQFHTIRQKLKRIKTKRGLHRKHRRELGFSSISLAGYTYAGKTTLFNALAREGSPTGKGLFTTLSTTTRAVDLLGKRVVLTDTVGFIDRLPITLIDAFRATLEETIFSDLILLVIDASDPLREIQRKLSTSLETIQKIGAQGIPTVTALNKIDLLPEPEVQQRLALLREHAPNTVPISARSQANITLLTREIAKHLRERVYASFSIPLTDETLALLSELFVQADVKRVTYQNDAAEVAFEAERNFADKLLGRVRSCGGRAQTMTEVN
jgi:GTP-binding protein HflX